MEPDVASSSLEAASIVTSERGWSRLALPAAVTMTALIAGLITAVVLLSVTLPASVPSSSGSDRGAAFAAIPLLAMGAIALLLTTRLPKNPVGWLLGASVIAICLLMVGSQYDNRYNYAHDVPEALTTPLGLLSIAGWSTGFPTLLILLPSVFPDGHVISRRWRIVVWLTVFTMAFTVVTSVLDPNLGGNLNQSAGPGTPVQSDSILNVLNGPVSGLMMLGLMAATVVSLVIRYRRADSELRHQLKWIVVAVAVGALALIPQLVPWLASGSPIVGALTLFAFCTLPVSIGIAVLKYRLYDIDLVISRALVYGALAVFITAIYVGIVVGIGTLVGSGGKPNLALSIVATAVVAVGFQPVRERLQRVANRFVYGKRATPYEVLSEFSERVAESYASEEVLPRMARVLAEGTGAEYATVWLLSAGRLTPAATHPDPDTADSPLTMQNGSLPDFPNAPRAVAVRHQNELLGALTVTKRHGESLTPIEEKLLDDLANQAGLVLKNVGLTADLQARLEDLRASRQRLVAAQDQERRRLERNLHDGAQQHLVAIKVKLGLAEALAVKDPDRARTLLVELRTDADEALQTLRDLARGIYPPLLADRGLAEALEAQARKATLPVTVEADGVGRYPQEVESAVYFCCLEALQNVQKYAIAATVTVTLTQSEGHVRFQVSDDGSGFDTETTTRGAGLQNMVDRADALGGEIAIASAVGTGTTITGAIPTAEMKAA